MRIALLVAAAAAVYGATGLENMWAQPRGIERRRLQDDDATTTAAPYTPRDDCDAKMYAMYQNPKASIGDVCDACDSFDGRFGNECDAQVHKGMRKGLCQKTDAGGYCYDNFMATDEFTSLHQMCALYDQCGWYYQMKYEAEGYCNANRTSTEVANLQMFLSCQQINGEFCADYLTKHMLRESDKWYAMCGSCFDYVNTKILMDQVDTADGGRLAVMTHVEECTYCTFSEVIEESASKVPQCDEYFETYTGELDQRVTAGKEEPPAEVTTTAAPVVVNSGASTAPMLAALAFVMSAFLL